jgi:IS605 OrfB family transposase
MATTDQPKLYKTYRFRVKDANSGKVLVAMGNAVNTVWNYCNEISLRSAQRGLQWANKTLLRSLTKGASRDLGLPSQVVQEVVDEFLAKRRAAGKPRLRWRVSYGARRSLGWVPFTNQDIAVDGYAVLLRGRRFRLWKHRAIEGRIKSGCFAQDARGRWYCSLVVEVARPERTNRTEIRGYDLGHTVAATGAVVAADGAVTTHILPQATFYRDLEDRLAEAQRKGRHRQTKTINAKIANRRKDEQHKFTRTAVNSAGAIFVGNISSTWQIASGKGKATLDVSWATLRNQMKYKGEHAGVHVAEVDERFTTQDCSACGARGGPKGAGGLAIRRWVCDGCGAVHDRDLNAALNIARLGCETLGLKWPGSPSVRTEQPSY